ncbi:MAG: hypothetical protein KME07_10870 [Pegethrix bostrychoides GSE-TBD4-15B]|jgi:hypothetical protein|uniref:Secreted protein n=1 Tax=Pegethrix bostrychoides GSE-TBD4-15B TaxID=2839662 RepID=A0A951PB65_9CYAN|nr:hypothetical protein [Pegethrix bostrychoides GSE-TBD4-15B]
MFSRLLQAILITSAAYLTMLMNTSPQPSPAPAIATWRLANAQINFRRPSAGQFQRPQSRQPSRQPSR